MPIEALKNLSPKERMIWEEVFKRLKETMSEESAAKRAWGAVKKYKQKHNKAKSSGIKTKYYIKSKSNFSDNQDYFAEIIFGGTKIDEDGDVVSYNILLPKLNGMKADIEHANLRDLNEFDKDYLFEVVDNFFDGENSIGLVKFNKNHGQFKSVWEHIDEFGASIEYQFNEDGAVRVTGLTGTFSPRYTNAKVINAYKN